MSLVLLVHVAAHTCALSLSHVIEIMRPLPVQPVADAPEMVLGLSVIRGTPVPVVAMPALFSADSGTSGRFVVVQTGSRRVALAVDEVFGIRDLGPAAALPPLLRDAARGTVEAVGALDSELLFVMNAARIVPGEVLESLAK